MRSANTDMAEMSLTQLDERIKMIVAKNEDVLRLSGAETDQKIEKNDEYTELIPPKFFSEIKPSTETKKEASGSRQTDSTTVGAEPEEDDTSQSYLLARLYLVKDFYRKKWHVDSRGPFAIPPLVHVKIVEMDGVPPIIRSPACLRIWQLSFHPFGKDTT
ncbi:hypothetical protein TNCV_1212131 [Trichonephila clavipes]|nr:hypothetical protein TNCV_1212131 [Trichonephila clavipes]